MLSSIERIWMKPFQISCQSVTDLSVSLPYWQLIWVSDSVLWADQKSQTAPMWNRVSCLFTQWCMSITSRRACQHLPCSACQCVMWSVHHHINKHKSLRLLHNKCFKHATVHSIKTRRWERYYFLYLWSSFMSELSLHMRNITCFLTKVFLAEDKKSEQDIRQDSG